MSWFGHINRMPETIIVNRIHKWKPFTGRPAGRPKYRWEGDFRNDVKKMKLMKWAEQVQDRYCREGQDSCQSCSAIEEEEELSRATTVFQNTYYRNLTQYTH